jgi:hypothetical protein
MFSGSRLPRSSRNAFDYRYLSAHEDALNVRAVWHLDKFVAQNAGEAHPVHAHSNRQRDSRWRFASLIDAEKFAHQFGGSLVAGR